MRHKSGVDISRQFVNEMNDEVVFFLVSKTAMLLSGAVRVPALADLSTAFGVEGRGVEDDLIEPLVFGFHFPVSKDAAFRFACVVAHEGGFAVIVHLHPIVGAEFARGWLRALVASMAASNPASSTSTPCSPAISAVKSTGNPKVSYSSKTTSPGEPGCF